MTSKNISRMIEWKAQVKEQVSAEMTKTREKLAQETSRLEGMRLKLAENMETMDHIQSMESMDTDKLELLSNYMIYLDKRMKEQEKRIAEIEKEVDLKQSELRNAYREERVLEILHSRISGEESKERRAAEQKETDFSAIRARKTTGL
ncbi:MAG: flagellar FliJ family protein [Nitrospiraceae bacterium]|nr:flagellar FliJ family protein [Nitrospiraceae bacterium]MDA8090841.1 flagellar FliJ family protein [Nitrospiraceae bacterium]